MGKEGKIPISQVVKSGIDSMPEGKIFDYSYFDLPQSGELTLAKALSRLTSTGIIQRLSKGKYYRPRNTIFGKIQPDENEIIRTLTYQEGRITGYLTGITIYNRLGLTTQVPNVLIIGTNKVLPEKKVNQYRIKYSKRNTVISEENIYLLQLLDALKDIKEIPDTSVDNSFGILLGKIRNLAITEQKRLLKLAVDYNPATRALVGALFEKYIPGSDIEALKKSLNGLSQFKIKISEQLLPNLADWNIK